MVPHFQEESRDMAEIELCGNSVEVEKNIEICHNNAVSLFRHLKRTMDSNWKGQTIIWLREKLLKKH